MTIMQAFKFFIKAAHNGGDEEKAINAAIHIVSTSKDDQLAAQLIGFLNGEQDNIPKVGLFKPRFIGNIYYEMMQLFKCLLQ